MATQGQQTAFGRPYTVPPVISTYRMISASGMSKGHEPHYHPDTIEICYVARGHLDWWISSEPFEIHSGDVLVIPPGVPHGSVDSTLQPCEYYAIHLASDEFSPAVAAVAEGLAGRYARRPEIGELVKRIFDEHRLEGACLTEVGSALAVLLVMELARQSGDAEKGRNGNLVRRAQAALDPCAGNPISVEAVAQRLGVSSVWLNRVFQAEIGESPGEWVRSRRLAEAKRLLALERASVTEIAIRLGYRSSQYFATAFRHDCGMTPSAYRALCAATWPMGAAASAVCAPIR